MTVLKPTSGLENFVERHRADLDAFEPRPDLWDALEARLDEAAAADAPPAPAADPAPNPFRIVPEPAAPPAAPDFGWPRYAAAAAVGLLLLAGGYGLHSSAPDAPADLATTETSAPLTSAAADFGDEATALPVSATGAARRLEKAVKRMEAYYGAQISEKQHELALLDAAAAPGTMPRAADWKQELASQDSVYRQLRTQLFQNPDPNAVLDAMNQNLQIRLDLLNQQLRTREHIRQYHDDAYNQAANK